MQALQEELRQVNLCQNVMNAMLMQCVGKVQGMEATMATKADADQVPTNEAFHQLHAAMETKADTDQVPTNEAFHQLQATMETKADAYQVPTNETFHQLQAIMETKADVDQVPTNGVFHQLQATMETKADADQVPTNEAFQQLQNTVATKADANQVPTTAAFQQLAGTVVTKADVDQVPTNEAFEQLQAIVETKAHADQVPTNEVFQQLRNTVATKVDANQMPTNAAFQQLQNEVGTRVAAINVALRQNIVSRQWRDGKTFRQGYCCETSNYRASIVMDVGFIYKIALRVIDHNRRHGAFVQGQVALLPAGNQTANGNSDNGDDSGGWSAEGHKPGVSLQYVWNINGHQYARAILTTGDTLDITLDHRSGRQIATFAKRGTEHHCSRPVEALPLFLAISLWSQGAFEITECSVSDVA